VSYVGVAVFMLLSTGDIGCALVERRRSSL
jgi:hypothetical protein